MRTLRDRIMVVTVLATLAVLAAACGLPPLVVAPGEWTPPPVTGPTAGATEVAALEATATETAAPATTVPEPSATATSAPTATVIFTPTKQVAAAAATATKPPTPKPSPTPVPSPTIDQHLIVITEEAIAQSLAGGAGAEQGLKATNLKVRFADGKVYVTADNLGYGAINVRNLNLVGRLSAQNGKLQLATESVSPGGLVGALIPGVANQAIGQLAANSYVEQVTTLPGRIELRIR
jgi:hypothetical protein